MGEYLEENCNDVTVKTVIKHESEWGDFLENVTTKFTIHIF